MAPALEPLVDLCLELGITSPEMERILRSVFVARAAELLARSRGRGRAPSDVRIGLMIGVHRNFVRRIRSTKRRAQLRGVEKRDRGATLLKAWASDWRFLDSGGQPRDLPIQAPDAEPCFEMLVRQHMPGVATGTAIAELRRSGAVRLLPDEVVRLRSRTPRPSGMTEAALSEVAERLRELSSTLLHNLSAPEDQRYCEGLDALLIDRERLGVVRQVIARRTRNFLDTLAAELRSEALRSARPGSLQLGFTAFAHEEPPGRAGPASD